MSQTTLSWRRVKFIIGIVRMLMRLILKFCSTVLLLSVLCGCDYLSPQRSFTLVIPEKDHSYNYASEHLKNFLEHDGYRLNIITCKTAIEANEMVARGEADLTFVLNHSLFVADTLSDESSKLRTILPLYTRLMFFFGKDPVDTLSIQEQVKNSTIHLEVLNGETHLGLLEMFRIGEIDSVRFVDDGERDFHHFWGTFYGRRTQELLDQGWHSLSLSKNWEDFLLLNNPSLRAFELPSIPGVDGDHELRTVATETLLVGSSRLGENAIHKLAQYIIQHKLKLISHDRMYNAIDEHFDIERLLYPLHAGTDAYLRRDEPSFLERYADALALVLSILAIIYGGIQTARNAILRKRKDQVDTYFIEFLDIRESHSQNKQDIVDQYDALLHKVLIQMTNEKLDLNDFHILSRLIQQELSNLKFDTSRKG